MDIREVYGAICASRHLVERLDDGGNATLKPYASGWLAKSDRLGVEPQVEYEYSIYSELHQKGLAGVITPECLLEEGVFGHPDTLVISQINMGASLGEYAEAYLAGQMSSTLWLDLCQKVGEIICRFHSEGFVHCDLHCGNVLVELSTSGEWRPMLIDFGLTSYAEIEYPYNVHDWSILDASSDVPFLVWSLEAIDPALLRADEGFQAGIAALMKAAN